MTSDRKQVATSEQIHTAIRNMAKTLCEHPGDGPWAVIGIRRGGEHLAKRLAIWIAETQGVEVPIGMVDITLYRDDGFGPHDWPEIGQTSIPFRLRDFTIVLVDDVLYTGRTVRAALDALVDFGRPKALRLAVLVDRGWRELPIRGDAVGMVLDTQATQHVKVELTAEASDKDAVFMFTREGTEGSP